jgi:hypothetical protein
VALIFGQGGNYTNEPLQNCTPYSTVYGRNPTALYCTGTTACFEIQHKKLCKVNGLRRKENSIGEPLHECTCEPYCTVLYCTGTTAGLQIQNKLRQKENYIDEPHECNCEPYCTVLYCTGTTACLEI